MPIDLPELSLATSKSTQSQDDDLTDSENLDKPQRIFCNIQRTSRTPIDSETTRIELSFFGSLAA
jgi:hypothetical protein